MNERILRELEEIVGADNLLADREELFAFECDGLTFHRLTPDLVVFPTCTDQVSKILALTTRYGIPVVARGAGTGLSGGALPARGGVVVETSRMKEIFDISAPNRTIRVGPGIVNTEVTRAASTLGFFFAPDPSSQIVCTLGGNVAENSGGPHCLKYGTTVNHVQEIQAVLGNGLVVQLGSPAADCPGYDLCGVFIGSEGTLGIATELRLRLTRNSPAVRTLLAAYADVDAATRSVSGIVAAGIIPVALEMMDRAIIQAVEDSHLRAGYPREAGAVLLIELDGLEAALAEQEIKIRDICEGNGCTDLRVAQNEAERAALWAGRKGAFGACGRLSPSMYLSDTVVPRNRLPEILKRVYEIAESYSVRVANVFHAGDGNLHPILLYDASDGEETSRVLEACREIMKACVAVGGCLSGEHGIGLEKRDYMDIQYAEQDLQAMQRLKRAFDPDNLCNPDKLLPRRFSCEHSAPESLP